MKQLLILSGKGGTGKTTIAAACIEYLHALAYADCDVDAPNLHLVLAALPTPTRQPYYGLPKAFINQDKCIQCGKCYEACRFQAIERHHGNYQIAEFGCEGCAVCHHVCPVGAIELIPAEDGELRLNHQDSLYFSTARLKMGSGNSGLLVTHVKQQLFDQPLQGDWAILDGSPGIGCPVIASLNGVDALLLVTEPSVSGISDMKRIIETARRFHLPMFVCVNKFDTHKENTEYIHHYCHRENIPFVGVIPYDKAVIEAVNQGKSIIQYPCPAQTAIIAMIQTTMAHLTKKGV